MRNKKVLFAVQAAMIAALYVVLTYITNLLGLASGTIQVRFSEALCILPVFTPAAIPGLFIGCLISNLITGGIIWDIIFGSIATLLGALGTYFLRKKKFVYTLPPVIANIIIVPLVLRYGYGFTTVTALKRREISTPLYTVVKPYPYLSTSGTIIMLAMTGGSVYTNFFFRRK